MYCLAFTGWAAVCCRGVIPGWDRKDICGAPEQRPRGRATPREAGAGGGSSSVDHDPHSPGHCRCPSRRPFSLTYSGLDDCARLLTVPRHVLGDGRLCAGRDVQPLTLVFLTLASSESPTLTHHPAKGMSF